MPVEIRELVIRATVTPEEGPKDGKDGAAEVSFNHPVEGPRNESRQLSPSDLDRIVSLCTSRVLRSMKRLQER